MIENSKSIDGGWPLIESTGTVFENDFSLRIQHLVEISFEDFYLHTKDMPQIVWRMENFFCDLAEISGTEF